MTTLTIPIPANTDARLKRYVKRMHARKEKVVQTAINRFLALQEFDEMQRLVEPHARKRGIRTDEDVFKVA